MFERQRNLEDDAEFGQGEPDWLRKAEQLVQEDDAVEEPEVLAQVGDGGLQPLETIIGVDVSSVTYTIDGIDGPADAVDDGE